MRLRRNHARSGRSCGFSLLEVILAIGIAVGLMLVVLFYYRQAAELRVQALEESERLRETRLVMQSLSDELRRMFLHADTLGFSGNSNSVKFATTRLPDRSQWAGGELGRATRPESDLAQVRYLGGAAQTNGLFRAVATLVPHRDPLDGSPDAESEDELEMEEPEESDTEAGDETDAETEAETDAEETEADDNPTDTVSPTIQSTPVLLTDNIRFSRFRFWGGEEWLDEWPGPVPPEALEITLGFEALPLELEPDQYPFEVFRRVVYLGSRGEVDAGASEDGDDLEGEEEAKVEEEGRL